MKRRPGEGILFIERPARPACRRAPPGRDRRVVDRARRWQADLRVDAVEHCGRRWLRGTDAAAVRCVRHAVRAGDLAGRARRTGAQAVEGQPWRFEEQDATTWQRVPATADPVRWSVNNRETRGADQRTEKARTHARWPRRLHRRRACRRRHRASGVPRGARTVAGLYNLKADPVKRDLFTFEEDGDRHALYWLRCRNRDDLVRRMRAMKAIADATYGFVGRSPDQVSGLVTGLAMNSGILEKLRAGFGQNLLNYYTYARNNDLYLSFAVTPASGRKSADLFPGQQRDDQNCRSSPKTARRHVSGMKMMATSAIDADEILIGNLTPIEDQYKSEAITAAMPLNAPGVSVVAPAVCARRKARGRRSAVVSFRRDRQRSVCDRAKIPWQRVFLHNEGNMSGASISRRRRTAIRTISPRSGSGPRWA